jgi:hypothetical protein
MPCARNRSHERWFINVHSWTRRTYPLGVFLDYIQRQQLKPRSSTSIQLQTPADYGGCHVRWLHSWKLHYCICQAPHRWPFFGANLWRCSVRGFARITRRWSRRWNADPRLKYIVKGYRTPARPCDDFVSLWGRVLPALDVGVSPSIHSKSCSWCCNLRLLSDVYWINALSYHKPPGCDTIITAIETMKIEMF